MTTQLVPVRTGALTRIDGKRLALFTRTVGKDLIGAEVDWAVELCEMYGANPFVKDIFFFIFNAEDKAKRNVVPVLSVGLYRKIAARSGNYRPDEQPPRFVYDEALVCPANPKGIVSCEVTVFRYAHGQWFPTPSRLKWEERAPIVMEGTEGFRWEPIPGEFYPEGHSKAGKQKHKKVPVGEITARLDPTKKNWQTMPETMLAKCCEVDAIRKGWPNETAGSYGEGELDALHTIELTATEVIEQEEITDRLSKIGGINTIPIDWLDGTDLVAVPVGKFYDRAMEFIQARTKRGEEEYSTIAEWQKRNGLGLRQFWGMEKDAALELRKTLDEVAKKASGQT